MFAGQKHLGAIALQLGRDKIHYRKRQHNDRNVVLVSEQCHLRASIQANKSDQGNYEKDCMDNQIIQIFPEVSIKCELTITVDSIVFKFL